MTTDTKRLREAAFRVIDEGGPSWFSAEQLGIKDGLDIPEVDAQFIALASPKVIVDLIDSTVYPGSKIDGMKAHIALLKGSIAQVEQENERLREALEWYASMAKRMGDAVLDQDTASLVALMKEFAVEYGKRARIALAQKDTP
ncbi:hypothetical protein [Castellaniella sp.]|uniref:hypothetical protein n=1 Tax=Castellaniella sp. TaxID=1955812 RepID=UPI003560ABC5